MNIDVEVKNLGQLKHGKIRIRPLTVIAGPNGTGKSFFTKFMYSFLNVINKNVFHTSIEDSIKRLKALLRGFSNQLTYASEQDMNLIRNADFFLDTFNDDLTTANQWNISEYLEHSRSKAKEYSDFSNSVKVYFSELSKKEKKYKSISRIANNINKINNELHNKLENSFSHYVECIVSTLDNELKENFQTPDIRDLISHDQNNMQISVSELFKVGVNTDGVNFSLEHEFINEVSSLSRVVFFESPAYWKVRDALLHAKNSHWGGFFINKGANNNLNGVPKYFYDLDKSLKIESKNENTPEVKRICDEIYEALNGEVLFKGDDLVFKEKNSGREISKNLISFGMTNLGMIQCLLKNNVVTPGSFLFIDEPETNLHPNWQVLLMQTLVALADNNINIIIATHSIDMLKALEVSVKETNNTRDITEFMSVNYFDSNGELFEFDSKDPLDNLDEAKIALNSSYSKLYFKGLKCDTDK